MSYQIQMDGLTRSGDRLAGIGFNCRDQVFGVEPGLPIGGQIALKRFVPLLVVEIIDRSCPALCAGLCLRRLLRRSRHQSPAPSVSDQLTEPIPCQEQQRHCTLPVKRWCLPVASRFFRALSWRFPLRTAGNSQHSRPVFGALLGAAGPDFANFSW